MEYDDIFIVSKAPKPLPKSELYDYLKKCSLGDNEAREKIIKHNIRLVINQVNKKFSNTPYERKELVSIGLIGLIKGIDTFDIEKKIEFSTYAIKCINNEILMFLRKAKKYEKDESIYQTIGVDKNGKELTLEDALKDDKDFVEEYTYNEMLTSIRQIVNLLEGRDKEIIMLRYGFIDNKVHTQQEIANKLGISRSYISRLETKILKRIRIELEGKEIIEKSNRVRNKRKKKQVQPEKEQLAVVIANQTEALNESLKESIEDDTIISKTSSEEKNMQNTTTYNSLESSPKNNISKDDYLKLLELLRTPLFSQMINVLSVKEYVIISLKLGYIDGKYFTTESIAKFLEIGQDEVRETIEKVLLLYKENINQFFDNVIKIVSDEPNTLKKYKN